MVPNSLFSLSTSLRSARLPPDSVKPITHPATTAAAAINPSQAPRPRLMSKPASSRSKPPKPPSIPSKRKRNSTSSAPIAAAERNTSGTGRLLGIFTMPSRISTVSTAMAMKSSQAMPTVPK